MTDQLPRQIDPVDAQVGQMLRVTLMEDDMTVTKTFSVAKVGSQWVETPGGFIFGFDAQIVLWELIAEAPIRRAGSHWSGPVYEGTVEYVRNQVGDYLPVTYPEGWRVAALRRGYDDAAIARLTSVPDMPQHGDGCSPWLWDKETDTVWVAGIGRATHIQVDGREVASGYLLTAGDDDPALAARLVPYSERGQK